MHQVRPALILAVRRAYAHAELTFMLTLVVLGGLAGAVALVLELQRGAPPAGHSWAWTIPARWVFAASVPLATYLFDHSYWRWRATGRQHGFIDQVLEPAGLRLVHPRPLGRTQQLLVGRGRSVEIAATLRHEGHGGRERSYRFTVSSRDGSFSFNQDVRIEKLSLAPLDESARDLRIEVVTSGAAELLCRRLPEVRLPEVRLPEVRLPGVRLPG